MRQTVCVSGWSSHGKKFVGGTAKIIVNDEAKEPIEFGESGEFYVEDVDGGDKLEVIVCDVKEYCEDTCETIEKEGEQCRKTIYITEPSNLVCVKPDNSIELKSGDLSDQNVCVSIHEQPQGGTLEKGTQLGCYTYTPKSGFQGNDKVTIKVKYKDETRNPYFVVHNIFVSEYCGETPPNEEDCEKENEELKIENEELKRQLDDSKKSLTKAKGDLTKAKKASTKKLEDLQGQVRTLKADKKAKSKKAEAQKVEAEEGGKEEES